MSRFIHDSYGGVPVGFASTEQLLVNMFNIFLDDSQQLHSPPIGLRFAGIVPIAIALLAMVYVARSEQAGPVFSCFLCRECRADHYWNVSALKKRTKSAEGGIKDHSRGQ